MTFGTGAVLNVGPRDHVVVFYRSEPDLADQVASYLQRSLAQGGSAIVIATPAHRQAFAERLEQTGTDVPAAQANGTYQAMDAAQTIESFVTGEWADAAKFWQEVSPVIRRATQAGTPVRAYGEMVALLWEAGLVDVAVEVEAMWNEIGAQYPFSLVCSYPTPKDGDAGDSDALTEVCRAHAMVVGSPPPAMRGWRYR